jgi:hypothetical protein
MLVEVTIAALLFAAWKKTENKGVLTPEREKAYRSALENLQDPESLRKLASAYESNGLAVEASMLRRRADLRGQSPEQKKARREAYDKGMASQDVAAIERLADAFEQITATGSAMALRKHAADVRFAMHEKNRPVVPETEPIEKEIGGSDTVVPPQASDEDTTVEAKAEIVNGSGTVPAHRPRRHARNPSSPAAE